MDIFGDPSIKVLERRRTKSLGFPQVKHSACVRDKLISGQSASRSPCQEWQVDLETREQSSLPEKFTITCKVIRVKKGTAVLKKDCRKGLSEIRRMKCSEDRDPGEGLSLTGTFLHNLCRTHNLRNS